MKTKLKRIFQNEQGFTLMELLAVILILGVLSGIAFSSFSGQGDSSRVTANESNIRTIETAVERYDLEQGFRTGSGATDFKALDNNHPIITKGYLKDVPKNPWVGTNKPQGDSDGTPYVYIITKDDRGVMHVYLADVTGTSNVVNNIVDEKGNVVTPAVAGISFVTTSPTGSQRFFKQS